MILDEEKVLEPFFNSAKHWSFEELSTCIELDDKKISSWLKKLETEDIIVRLEKHGKTFYRYKHEGKEYWKRKKEFSRKLIQESGLIKKLMFQKKAKVIILYGSFIDGSWYQKSDVDIFIYGESDITSENQPWIGLGWKGILRDVEFHIFETKEDLKNVNPYFLNNVKKGWCIKGNINDLSI